MSSYDAIAVLGGGIRSGGTLPSWVRRRLDRAIALRGDAFIMPLSASTTHRPPPLQPNGFPLLEAVAGAKYLIDRGVPADRIFAEACSYDTIGNAYFSRVVHVDPQQFQKLLVITSDWHMPRTKIAFDWVYSLSPRAVDYQLTYEAVDDPEMSLEVREGRWRKEQAGALALQQKTGAITTLKQFHSWLFTQHEAYHAEAKAFGSTRLTEAALNSY